MNSAIICSAGKGNRLGLNIPKGLVEIDGKTLVEHQLDVLKDIENIYIVVGYKAELMVPIIEKARPDANICYNYDYETTNCIDSLRIGLDNAKDSFIYMDGDMIINKNSFDEFLATPDEDLVCIATVKTEDACLVDVNEKNEVLGFQNYTNKEYEWCGVAKVTYELAQRRLSQKSNCFVFELFTENLPMQSFILDCCEVDTPRDYEIAKEWLKTTK